MKKLLLLSTCLLASIALYASHVHSANIRVEHISSFDYRIHLSIYRDATGIAIPSGQPVEVFQRDGATQIASFSLQKDTTYIVNPSILGCPTGILYDVSEFSIVVTLPPTTYNHPGGYLFAWQSCCRPPGLLNLVNASSSGQTALTLFPPVVDGSGNQILNSSPVLQTPISDYALDQVPFSKNFGGIDPDGDSLAYALYTPMDDGTPSIGNSNPVFAPYSDPSTQVPPIQWAQGYGPDNQIHGFPGPNPSPNRLQVDPVTGVVSVIPNAPIQSSRFVYGIVCKEYRNGSLIGAVYRDNILAVVNNGGNPIIINTPPVLNVTANQTLSTWSGDTLIFTGSPVCVQLEVTDADSVADISLELIQSDYDSSDISFLQSAAVIRNNDTFSTALCFAPDSFLSISSQASVLAFDNLCYNIKSDTVDFWFKFVGYSNAGLGGSVDLQIGSNPQPIPLFSLLNHNPNPGGVWTDLDNSGLLNANNEFDASAINNPVTYRFLYVDQQPNYPADSALLTLNFVNSTGLDDFDKSEISIYPNPSNGEVSITVPKHLLGVKAEIFTYDLKKVDEFLIESTKQNIQIEGKGLYFIRVGTSINKLIIQ